MKEIAVSKFKATCLALLEEVQRTGEPLRVTKFGYPLAMVVPARQSRGFVGALRGHIRILGDVVSPASDANDGEALK